MGLHRPQATDPAQFGPATSIRPRYVAWGWLLMGLESDWHGTNCRPVCTSASSCGEPGPAPVARRSCRTCRVSYLGTFASIPSGKHALQGVPHRQPRQP
jgi:hypothetical protein